MTPDLTDDDNRSSSRSSCARRSSATASRCRRGCGALRPSSTGSPRRCRARNRCRRRSRRASAAWCSQGSGGGRPRHAISAAAIGKAPSARHRSSARQTRPRHDRRGDLRHAALVRLRRPHVERRWIELTAQQIGRIASSGASRFLVTRWRLMLEAGFDRGRRPRTLKFDPSFW